MARSPRRVIQCDEDGRELRVFESSKEAASEMQAPSPNHIHKSIRYGWIAYGYRWKYKGCDLFVQKRALFGQKRSVVALLPTSSEEQLYVSISAAAREIGVSITSVESSLKTGCLIKGYRFFYQGEKPIIPAKSVPIRKMIELIDSDGNIVKTLQNADEAANYLGLSRSMIYRCVNPKNKGLTAKGFLLRYKE